MNAATESFGWMTVTDGADLAGWTWGNPPPRRFPLQRRFVYRCLVLVSRADSALHRPWQIFSDRLAAAIRWSDPNPWAALETPDICLGRLKAPGHSWAVVPRQPPRSSGRCRQGTPEEKGRDHLQ
jgi:hypothetical protein